MQCPQNFIYNNLKSCSYASYNCESVGACIYTIYTCIYIFSLLVNVCEQEF